MAKKRKLKYPECHIVAEKSGSANGCDLFIIFDGQKIAKRGYPDTPQAKTWVSLEPGFAVYDDGSDGIVIEHNGIVVVQ